MENLNVIQSQDVLSNQINNTLLNDVRLNWTGGEKSFSEILSSEACNNFVDYIELLGLKNDPNMVVLSSKHHYYYDPEELINVNTITNLKELNQIKQIKSFVHSVRIVLQQRGNFIGYFTDNTPYNGLRSILKTADSDVLENGIGSRNPFLKMVFSIMGSRINMYMTKKSVRQLLEEYGFRVLDMTELNGQTYFHAQIA
ncbi:MAG: hypothetical protein WA816_05500 [Bacteroidales bacterium]